MSDKPRLPQSAAKPPAGANASRGEGASPRLEDEDEALQVLQPARSPDELGRLAHYRILKILGRGGMGTVFMAEDPRLHRLIALKVMLPSIAKKKSACERFTREAQATAKIEHDHIVTIFEVNEDHGIPYLAMQFLKGMTLDDWLKAGKTLNIPQIMRIGKEIAKGLAAAHSCQLIHRDIKPSNIWLDATNRGRVKILDFGLARPTNEDTHLTQEGMILGTPAFMSPEQARGQNVDERSDLFSLGCVLYRLCSGRLPFTGKDAMSMLIAITTQEPDFLELVNAEVPASFARFIHRLLAKDSQERPASAREAVQAIQNIEREWMSNSRTVSEPAVPSAPNHVPAALVQEEADPAPEESAITDLELSPVQPSGVVKPAKSSFAWMLAGLTLGVLIAAFSVACCLGVLIATDKGKVRVFVEDDAAHAQLHDVGVTVHDGRKNPYVLKGAGEHALPAGDFRVESGSLPGGLQVTPDSFVVRRGETLELKMRVMAPEPSPALKKVRPPLERVTTENAKKLQAAWARYLGREIVETNSAGMKLVLIPAGEFMMGSSKEFIKQQLDDLKRFEKKAFFDKYKAHLSSEMPAHPVRITRPYYLGMHEVTIEQFAKFVAAEKYVTEVEKSKLGGTGLMPSTGAEIPREILRKPEFNWKNTGATDLRREQPVCNVTWGDAEAFCKWLREKEFQKYRLPTEAEWEYACRAGTTSPWHFGDDVKLAHETMHSYRPKELAAGKGAHAVGKKKPNEFGLFDMHGNVEEMCSDSWGEKYYESSPRDDPQGPPENPGKTKSARGGSFKDLAYASRSAYRNAQDADKGQILVGFRVVCEIALPPEKK